jgi:hypothetical protein
MKYALSVMFALVLCLNATAGETAVVVDEPVAVADCGDCCCEGVIAKVVKAPFRVVGKVAQCMKQRRCCKPCEVKPCEVKVEEVKEVCVKRCRPRLCRSRVKVVTVNRCCK